jgi:hypothetical protein
MINNDATMEVTLAVLADYANVTGSGKLNVMGIFGEVNPPVLPDLLGESWKPLTFKREFPQKPTLTERYQR